MKNNSLKLFILILLAIFIGGCSAKPVAVNNIKSDSHTEERLAPDKLQNNSGIEDTIKLADNDFQLYHVQPITYGLAMHYSVDDNYFDPKSELIINQYGNEISAKDLADNILQQIKDADEKVFLPFVAPDSQGRSSYIITSRDVVTDSERATAYAYLSKVFEDNGSTYSIIYRQKIESKNKEEAEEAVDQWLLDNSKRYYEAFDEVDLSKNILFYSKNKELASGFSKSNKYSLLKWKTEKIQEKNAHTRIDIEYPKFIGDWRVAKLNNLIKEDILNIIAEDRAEVNDLMSGKSGVEIVEDCRGPLLDSPDDYYPSCSIILTSRFEVHSVINDIVSIKIVFTDFTGGGAGNHDMALIINYNLKTNKVLEPNELFCRDGYINKLASIIKPDLYKILSLEYNKKFNEAWIDDGVNNAEYYNYILIDNFGLIINFPSYTVASGVAGIVPAFVPYSSISDLVCLP